MGFYVSSGDVGRDDVREVYRANRIGFSAKRIPRKAKKRLRKDWLRGRHGR